MTTYQFFTTAWTWNSIVLILRRACLHRLLSRLRQRGRPLYFAAALVVFLLALISPFNALANGYLFSATWFSTSCSFSSFPRFCC